MKKQLKKCLAAVLSLAMTVTLLPAPTAGQVQAEGNSDAPQPVLHYDMTHKEGKLTDVTGNNHDGTLRNITDADFSTGDDGRTATDDDGWALNFDGKAASAAGKYVEIPAGVIKGNNKEEFTIEATYTNNTVSDAWLFTLGTTVKVWDNDATKRPLNYLFVSPNSNQENYRGKMLGAIKSGTDERRYDAATAMAGETTGKNIVTVVFKDGNVDYYLNGLKAETTETEFKIQEILAANSTNTCIGYIGKSLWSADPYFKGTLRDFKIYEEALTQEQVLESHKEIAEPLEAPAIEKVNAMKAKIEPAMLGENANKDHVVSDLSFPADIDGVALTWKSGDTTVISDKGKVTPKDTETNVTITVKGTYNRRGEFTETYTVKVVGKSDAEYESLTIPNKDDIRGNITLPAKGIAGSDIIWEASPSGVISVTAEGDKPAGVVTRGDVDTPVKLTATIKQAGGDRKKEFDVTVKKKATVGTMTDYVFAYFIGNGAGEEQIYLATSRDGLNWEELNDGKPVLESEMGTTGLRDPFVLRSPEGDKFYLIATDLCIAKNGNWDYAQKNGSQALMVWESDDLIHWTNQRMAIVSAQIEAGCTWAPEIYYDDQTGEYMVFWASRVKGNNYDHHRIYYCKTRDFYTFTEPQVWIDNGHSTIDTTIIQDDNGTYYRYSKYEGKNYVYVEKSDSLFGTWENIGWDSENNREKAIASGVEGPCCFRFNDDDIVSAGAKYALLVDNYGGGGYFPMVTDDLSTGEFRRISANLPSKPRHGTVMNITESEYNALEEEWGKPTLAAGEIPDVVGTGYELPTTVKATYAGQQEDVTVTWDKTVDDFKTAGTVTVTGTFTMAGKTATVTKKIEVIELPEDLIYFIDSGVGSWNKDRKESGYYKAAALKEDLRNPIPDKIYTEGSWGIVNPNEENVGCHTSATDSIYANGWYAYGGKTDPCKECEYIIPLENGAYKVTGYFQEWWGGDDTGRSIDFYADYTDDAGNKKTSDVKNIAEIGDNGTTHKLEIEFTVEGVTNMGEIHFHAKNKEGTNLSPVISGLSIQKVYAEGEKEALEANKNAAKQSLENVTATESLDLKLGGEAGQITVNYPSDLNDKAEAAGLGVITSFKSSNPTVATVDEAGKVTAVAEGTAKITTTVAISSKISKSVETTVEVTKVPVESVSLDQNEVKVSYGQSVTLVATVNPENASNKSLNWESGDKSIATVSNKGKVTAKGQGTTTITVTSEDNPEAYATCTVTVVVPVTSIGLNKTELSLKEGSKETLTVSSYVPENTDEKAVTWSSDNPNAAAVNKDTGEVTAVKAGNANITATSVDNPNVKATCKVTVTADTNGGGGGGGAVTPPAANQKVTKVTLNKTKLTLGIKDKFTLKATSDPAEAVKSVAWTVDKKGSKIVKINAKTGKVEGKKKGKATVTVTVTSKDGSKITKTCKITVKPAPTKKTKISVKKSITVKAKGSTTLKPKVKGNFGCSTFKFTSKNKKVAKVDASGKVTGVKKGKTTITVSTYNKKAKTTVKVTVK